MTIDGLGAARLMSVTLLRRFPRDPQLRRKAFEFEDELKPYIDASVNITGDAARIAPEQPLFSMNDGKRLFFVSEIAVQMTLNFDIVASGARLFDKMSKGVDTLDHAVDKLIGDKTRYYSGFVVEFICPVDATIEKVAPQVAERLSDKAWASADVNSIELLAGRQEQDVNRTVSLSFVSSFSGLIKPGVTQIHVDPDFDQLSNLSLMVKADVNTKPTREAPARRQFTGLLPHLRKCIETDMVTMIGNLAGGSV